MRGRDRGPQGQAAPGGCGWITLVAGAVVTVVAIVLSRIQLWAALPPDHWPDLGAGIITAATRWPACAQTNFAVVTQGIQDVVTDGILNPFESLLTGSPWFVVGAVLVVLAYLAGRWRVALIAVVAVAALIWLGVWNDAMYTLASTLSPRSS